MTSIPLANTDHIGQYYDGSRTFRIIDRNLQIPFIGFGYVFGTPKQLQVGPRGIMMDVWGGASTYWVLTNPNTIYNATVDVYGHIWHIRISFRTNSPNRFVFIVRSPRTNTDVAFNNARQLFHFIQNSSIVQEDSLYDAIILSNGQTMRSILTLNQVGPGPSRRRTPYCLPTQTRVSSARFNCNIPGRKNEYIILRYEYTDSQAMTGVPDICVGDVFDGTNLTEVIDVADFMDWERIVTVRGVKTKQTVANFATT